MARPSADESPLKYDKKGNALPAELSTDVIRRLSCPEGTKQVFLTDTRSPNLRVRALPSGKKSYVFEASLLNQSIRITLGDVRAKTLADARGKANEYRVMVDDRIDPRKAREETRKELETFYEEELEQAMQLRAVWDHYLRVGKPKKKDAWKPRYVEDLKAAAAPARPKLVGTGMTLPGPLASILDTSVGEIDEDAILKWNADLADSRGRNTSDRALQMLRGCFRWAASRIEYKHLLSRKVVLQEALAENKPKANPRTGRVRITELKAWFAAVRLLEPIIAVLLQFIVLTGCRKEEATKLTWDRVDFRNRELKLADKVNEFRTIPLGRQLAALLETLGPRRSGWVFPSSRGDMSVSDPRKAHARALASAEILSALTNHDLRRTFRKMAESAGVHPNIVKQLMGHSPGDVSEIHYTPRDVDDLRPFVRAIEEHILEEAGIPLVQDDEPRRIRVLVPVERMVA